MPELVRQGLIVVITFGLLLYSLARIVGGPVLLLEMHGFIKNAKFTEQVDKLKASLPEMNAKAFLPMNATVYLSYSLLMGVILFAGSALILLSQHGLGLTLVFAYCVLFGFAFINFRSFNRKVAHLGVTLLLAVILAALLQAAQVRTQAAITRSTSSTSSRR